MTIALYIQSSCGFRAFFSALELPPAEYSSTTGNRKNFQQHSSVENKATFRKFDGFDERLKATF
jgi:hypothetical protein